MQTRCQPLLGTLVEITVPDAGAGAIDGAFAAIAQVQTRMSFHDEDSDLAMLRNAGPGEAVEVAPETLEVLGIALELHRNTNGLFDVTIGRELVRDGFLPQPEGPEASHCSGTSADIEIVDDRRVRCHEPMLIDLGGIAKGFAVDRAVAALEAAGVTEGLVNAGGDLRMFGARDWTVGLRDGDGKVRERIALADCAIASSANAGSSHRRQSRLFAPHFGAGRAPVAVPTRVSVIADRCVIADALTKVAIAAPASSQWIAASYGARILRESALEKAA
ncbi:thiamine biosynthesis lipoprotein [Novosphingobium kunmingense]|uniref:FAD:protein FMN transferase n=1 Tax=Novosphingobium kunmingense TaxID=1211806 RepID=A0A2N0H7M0_9SPHN|nr:FAD:protein FMN transferase [Novosphingobium kunmingense]PKB14936.1 thiamine biosynthesis lipoprotein [Novosphingobium kunmingense]